MSRSFVWDLDDTLIATQVRFNEAIWQCGEVLNRAIGHGIHRPANVLALHDEAMAALMHEGMRANEAFVEAWLAVYHRALNRLGRPHDESTEQLLRTLAARSFQPPFQLLPSALAVLTVLRQPGDRHHLLTLTHGAQQVKIDSLGLGPHFDSIAFAEQKVDKRWWLEQLLGDETGPRIVIGDSRGVEIRYAVELGYTAIWLHHVDPWGHFEATDLDPASYHTVHHLTEIPSLVRRLLADAPRST